MTEQKPDPTAGLFAGTGSASKPSAEPSQDGPHEKGSKPPGPPNQDHSGTKPETTKPVEPVVGQATQQPQRFTQQAPAQAVAGPAQSTGLVNLRIVSTDENGNDIPAGALKSVREEFTGIGWKHLDDARITSLGTVVQLKRGQRLTIECVGDV